MMMVKVEDDDGSWVVEVEDDDGSWDNSDGY